MHKPLQIYILVWCSGKLYIIFGIPAVHLLEALGSSLSESIFFHLDVFPMCGSAKFIYLLLNIVCITKVGIDIK